MNLQFYSEKMKAELYEFSLAEEQHQFTALPSEALEIEERNRYPVVIMEESRAVGFFVLHKGSAVRDYSRETNALLLRAFSIDGVQQGKGYAKAAMRLLPSFVLEHFPGTSEIVLAVNERNTAARTLYMKSAFKDDGKKLMGRKGLQSILTRKLS
ncbi:MAG: GNAT family N-acetyltransferase [Bacillota bacterium]